MVDRIEIFLSLHPSGKGLVLSILFNSDGSGVSCRKVMSVPEALESAAFLRKGYERIGGELTVTVSGTATAYKCIHDYTAMVQQRQSENKKIPPAARAVESTCAAYCTACECAVG